MGKTFSFGGTKIFTHPELVLVRHLVFAFSRDSSLGEILS